MRVEPARPSRSTAGRHRLPRHPRRALVTVVAALTTAACEIPDPVAEAPSVIIAPDESTTSPFTVSGLIRIGSGECGGGPAVLREVTNAACADASSCAFAWEGVNVSAPDIAASLGPTNVADNSRPYSTGLNRYQDSTLIQWAARHTTFASRPGPEFAFGGTTQPGTSRRFSYVAPPMTSPLPPNEPGGTDTVTRHFPATNPGNLANLTSLRLELEMPWSFANCNATTGCGDDIVSVRIQAGDTGASDVYAMFTSERCLGAGKRSNGTSNCFSVPAGSAPEAQADGFIRSYLQSDGTVISAAGAAGNASTTRQRVTLELLVVPDTGYDLEVRVQLRNGSLIEQNQTFGATLVSPCGVTWLKASAPSGDPAYCPACLLARPPQSVEGTLHLDIPSTDGVEDVVSASQWSAVFIDSAGVQAGVAAGGTTLTYPAPPGNVAIPYHWDLLADRYRMRSRSSNRADTWDTEGNIDLAWSNRPDSPFIRHPATYRFPLVGAEPAGQVWGSSLGLDGSGAFYIDANETQVVNRYAPVQFVRGAVTFVGGCDLDEGIIQAGVAELEGVGNGNAGTLPDEKGHQQTLFSGNYGAFARGLFYGGADADPATVDGEFEIAASPGDWRERGYRLRLASPDINGDLWVFPKTDRHAVTLAANGRGAEAVLPVRELPVTQIGIPLAVNPASERIRNPIALIGDDLKASTGVEAAPDPVVDFPGRIPYHDVNQNVLGAFTARGEGAVDGDGNGATETVSLLAMANSEVTVTVTAEYSTLDPQTQLWSPWVRQPFMTKTMQLTGSCGVCLLPDGSTVEDGGDPQVSPNPIVLDLPAYVTTATINATIVDDTIFGTSQNSWRLEDGAGNVVDQGGGTSVMAQVDDLTEGTHTFTLTVTDCLQHSTSVPVTITVAAPLCPPADTPDMCEADNTGAVSGSAFWIDLVDGSGQSGALLCTVAGPGQAPICDPNTLTTTAQCGN